MFGNKLKIFYFVEVPQEHHMPRFILNLSVKPNEVIPSVNSIMDRWVHPESIQFGRTFPHILQEIWETDPDKLLIWVSKIDMMNAYHRGMPRTS